MRVPQVVTAVYSWRISNIPSFCVSLSHLWILSFLSSTLLSLLERWASNQLIGIFCSKCQHANREKYNTTFVWKTQNPGSSNCDNFKAPTKTNGYPIPDENDPYTWNNFPLFDKYIRNNAQRYGFKLLDMSPLYYRPDAHVGGFDCLHFCMPGPVDLFSILLLQMLYNGEI